MKIRALTTHGYASNCYLIFSGGDALLVDPSAPVSEICEALAIEGASLRGIVLTHAHYDHLLSLKEVRERWNCPVAVHTDDANALGNSYTNVSASLFSDPRTWEPAERLLKNGDILTIGSENVAVFHTPGHTPGSIVLLCGDAMLTGDTIFSCGYGRYDLPGGDASALERSLRSLRNFGSETVIYPGHGPKASLGQALMNIGIC